MHRATASSSLLALTLLVSSSITSTVARAELSQDVQGAGEVLTFNRVIELAQAQAPSALTSRASVDV
ncbi:MAG TPA: hypothetical protein VGF99_20780, partial [Myxococcota bacterium]